MVEEGRLGICLAVEPRVYARIEPAESLAIRTIWGAGKEETFEPGETPQRPNLRSVVLSTVQEEIPGIEVGEAHPDHALQGYITVDSTAFYDKKGQKKGLGSSAAATLVLCAALMYCRGVSNIDRETLFTVSLKAHRRFQGGRGSGYDVATSLNGGAGLFAGGLSPTWEPTELNWLPNLYLRNASLRVKTMEAIQKYEEWKTENPDEARVFLEESDGTVKDIAGASSRHDAFVALRNAARIGNALGDKIDVTAALEPDIARDIQKLGWGKALGAGNELALLMSEEKIDNTPWIPVIPAAQGLRWE